MIHAMMKDEHGRVTIYDIEEEMDTGKMRLCSHLLPDPGGEVVRECLDEIERLGEELNNAYERAAQACEKRMNPVRDNWLWSDYELNKTAEAIRALKTK